MVVVILCWPSITMNPSSTVDNLRTMLPELCTPRWSLFPPVTSWNNQIVFHKNFNNSKTTWNHCQTVFPFQQYLLWIIGMIRILSLLKSCLNVILLISCLLSFPWRPEISKSKEKMVNYVSIFLTSALFVVKINIDQDFLAVRIKINGYILLFIILWNILR